MGGPSTTTVGTDKEASDHTRSSAKVSSCRTFAKRPHIGDLVSPLDHCVGQGVEQDVAQVAT